MSVLSYIIISSIFVSLISLVGGFILISPKILIDKFSAYLVSFAAGVMLATAFLDLLPESFEGNITDSKIFFATLLGIVIFFFLERFVLWFHHHDNHNIVRPSAILILLGDSFHNFFDGLAIAASFLVNPGVGIATTLAITAHEIPHEIADLGILIYGGMQKKKALIYNFISALTAMIGALGGYFFLGSISDIKHLFLAFTAGNFIYISCSDLIPELHRDFKHKRNWSLSLPFLIGLFVAWAFVRYIES